VKFRAIGLKAAGKHFRGSDNLSVILKSQLLQTRCARHERRGIPRARLEDIDGRFHNFRLCRRLRGTLPEKRALIAACLAALAAWLPACTTTTRPLRETPAAAGVIEDRFEVRDPSGATTGPVGFIAKTRYRFDRGDLVLWLVENEYFQDVGFFDEHGRAFRRIPFQDDPQWVATSSMEECARMLLKLDRPVSIAALPPGELPPRLRHGAPLDASAEKLK
jgi:hypothetical protein